MNKLWTNCELNVKTHKILKKEKKKQDKIDKKHKSIRKGGSAKRRETIENRENKSCSPHNADECPRETELNGGAQREITS